MVQMRHFPCNATSEKPSPCHPLSIRGVSYPYLWVSLRHINQEYPLKIDDTIFPSCVQNGEGLVLR